MSKKEIIIIKVIPASKINEVIGWEGDVLKIRLKAIAEGGRANDALIAFLAEVFKLQKRQISILSGFTSRVKRIALINTEIDKASLFR